MVSLLAAALLAQGSKPLADLPFVHETGRIWLKATLNGKPVDALLDTGAQWCVADSDAASAAGAKPGGYDVSAKGIGGKGFGAWSTAGLSLAVDGLEAAQSVGVAADLGRVQRKGPRRIGVLLGGDFLKRFVVEIDYPASRVRFYDPKAYVPREGLAPMPMRLVDDRPVVDFALHLPSDDERKVSALIDTGSNGIILTGSYVRREGLLKRYPDAKPFKGSGGLGGQNSSRLLLGVSASYGVQDWNGPVLMDLGKGGITGLSAQFDALLGEDVLLNCLVAFDYGRSTMYMGYFGAPKV